MKVLSKKIFQVEEPDLKVTFDIYLISSKSELEGLLNKFKVVRGLWNGKKLYVWDAGKCDHTYVSGYLSENEPNFKYREYIGITLDSDGPYEDFVKNKQRQRLLDFLKVKYF